MLIERKIETYLCYILEINAFNFSDNLVHLTMY